MPINLVKDDKISIENLPSVPRNFKKKTIKNTSKPKISPSQQKPLDALRPIHDGYEDLYDQLELKDTKCEIGRIVKYIIESNVLVHNLNVTFSNLSERGSALRAIK